MRELIDEQNECRTVLNQTAACVSVGDIAHLLIGNVENAATPTQTALPSSRYRR